MITEAALAGEWFYLEEEQPLDRSKASYYTLGGGTVRYSGNEEFSGSYQLVDGVVHIEALHGGTRMAITLRSTDDQFDEASRFLQSSTIYSFGQDDPDGEPFSYHGAFVRRTDEVISEDDLLDRVEGRNPAP